MIRPASIVCLALLVTACATSPEPATRTETQRQDRAVWEPIPQQYTAPLPYPQAAPHPLTCADLEDLLDQALLTIEQCNADRADLKRFSPEPPP